MSLRRHAALAAVAVGLLAFAYAIAIALNAGLLPAVSIDRTRLLAGGFAVALSIPLVGLLVSVGIRWGYMSVGWRRADTATRIAMLSLFAAAVAEAAAGWLAFAFILRSTG